MVAGRVSTDGGDSDVFAEAGVEVVASWWDSVASSKVMG